MFRLLGWGTDQDFFQRLARHAQTVQKTAEHLHALVKDFSQAGERSNLIEQCKRESDEMALDLIRETSASFITPLDKEDLESLSRMLEQIPVAISAAAARLVLYRMSEPRADLDPFVGKLVQITQATTTAVTHLSTSGEQPHVREQLRKVVALEIEGDLLYRQVLSDLLNAPNADPIMVIKWKDVYDWVETAIDRSLPVARVLEIILVKYA